MRLPSRSVGGAASIARFGVLGAILGADQAGGQVVGRRRPSLGRRLGAAGFRSERRRRHLAQREVFREAPRGKVLVGAGEKREEGATSRIGTSSPALVPGRHAGASQRVLEQPQVGVRGTQQDCHLVERHAAVRFGQRAPRDLHRLAPFARRGEQRHRGVDLPGGGAVDGEKVLLQAGKSRRGRDPPPRGGAGAGRRADGRRHDEPQAADRSQRPPVRGGQRDGGAARAGEQGGDKALFDDGGDGHVEQDEHRPGAERLVLGDGCGRRGPQAGPRHRGGLRGFTGEPLQECREIAAGPVERGQHRRRHGGHLQLVQRARGGAREARRPGHRREVLQRALLDRVEPGASDNRFRADGAGRVSPCRESRGSASRITSSTTLVRTTPNRPPRARAAAAAHSSAAARDGATSRPVWPGADCDSAAMAASRRASAAGELITTPAGTAAGYYESVSGEVREQGIASIDD